MGRGGGSGSSSQESSPSSSCIRSLMSSSLPTICTPEARATRSMWAFSAFIMYVAGAHPSFPFCLQKCYILNVLSGFFKNFMLSSVFTIMVCLFDPSPLVKFLSFRLTPNMGKSLLNFESKCCGIKTSFAGLNT